jgi:integrase
MAGAVRHLVERDGRYWARLVVPALLRPIIGKTELRQPLGGDRRLALRSLPAAVADLQDRLTNAEAKVGKSAPAPLPRRSRPLDPHALARTHYSEEIALDERLRDTAPRATLISIDDSYVGALREIAAGRADDELTMRVLADVLIKFGQRGQYEHTPGSPTWRQLTRLLAQAELAALNVMAHRDDGEPDPATPAFLETPVASSPAVPRMTIRDLFEGYRTELQRAGKGRDADRKWLSVISNLIAFLGHNDAQRVTRKDAVRWKDRLAETFAPKTVRDRYIATARAAFAWAVDNEHLEANPFGGVKVIYTKPALDREKGFTDEEAIAILKAARDYVPPTGEHPKLTAAKRWSSLLAAYTGARIGELMQLRQQDVQERDGIPYLRLTPEAGTIKSRAFRDVPLHPAIVEAGFLEFVTASGPGPLFFREIERTGRSAPASTVSNKVAAWTRSLDVADKAVPPNHGWRHRLKTIGRELGIDPRVLDAVQGHAPRTAGDSYGDVSLKAKSTAIAKLPRYALP